MTEPIVAANAPASADAGARMENAAPGDRSARQAYTRPLPDDALIIVPVRNVVLFPGMVLPLTVGRERSRAAAHEAARLQRPLGVLLQSNPEAEEPGPDDLHWVGTTANVLRYITGPDDTHHAICQGAKRFRVLQFLDGYPFMAATGGAHRRTRARRPGHRRTRAQPQAARGRGPPAAAAGSRRGRRRRCRASPAPRASPTSSPA